ncbi:MAG: Arginine biosynthesis bifunctional protein ArgJ [Candidatus Kaiserbacteria bacterium GW2011_GWA2_49_19]|uniref:Arginine biosynthesis bifunctional protein ArgJ n=1 Tax=Candidatus Kaiserbacteria bacterium GW2011_GWA2_49_19 TaxID=1618669 RepID=A0A0G1VQ86_9BACT|nr:MAG: Arginine biosynthesis bifunctional protein ArgJ [Candidatus Kaiserbacteria bacterium GW2011_GWA2_49_19]
MIKAISGGVTAPVGFKANGLYCGIKKSKASDLAIIFSERLCDAAGVFTTNKVKASCVVINSEHLKNGKAQAIIANSGNANCMTGKKGFADSRAMAFSVAKALDLKKEDVCVASTGVIGHNLPIHLIEKAVPELAKGLSGSGSKKAARGIMTTDKTLKETAVEFMIGKQRVRMGAIAKGAGMIHPQMALAGKHATMLCFVTTDALIAPQALHSALDIATQNSFNMITIDGDMSTNDMVLVLANGMARNKTIAPNSKEAVVFGEALETILLKLAQRIVRDAEGATKFVTVSVTNAKSPEDARQTARAVASSTLVKCALFGSDPNWGRIAAAAGRSGASIDPWKMRIYLGKFLVLNNGGAVARKSGVLDRELKKKEIAISIDLGIGSQSATAYTCDLSTKYVKLNSAYHT